MKAQVLLRMKCSSCQLPRKQTLGTFQFYHLKNSRFFHFLWSFKYCCIGPLQKSTAKSTNKSFKNKLHHHQMLPKMWKKTGTLLIHCWWEYNSTATLEKFGSFLQNYVHIKPCIQMFIVALFRLSKPGNNQDVLQWANG